MAAGFRLPVSGCVFISVQDEHKERMAPVARAFAAMGFEIAATAGTAAYLMKNGVAARTIRKVSEGRPHVLDAIKNGETLES